jgi:hypothetical protein
MILTEAQTPTGFSQSIFHSIRVSQRVGKREMRTIRKKSIATCGLFFMPG